MSRQGFVAVMVFLSALLLSLYAGSVLACGPTAACHVVCADQNGTSGPASCNDYNSTNSTDCSCHTTYDGTCVAGCGITSSSNYCTFP